MVLCFSALMLFHSEAKSAEPGETEAEEVNNGADIMDKLKEGAQKATKIYKSTADKIENWSREKLNNYLQRISSYRPVLREAGFKISRVRVRMGVVPRATIVCTQNDPLEKPKRKELLKKHSDKKVLTLFLKLLFKAYDTEISGYETRTIWVTLSVTPHSTAIMVPENKTPAPSNEETSEEETQ